LRIAKLTGYKVIGVKDSIRPVTNLDKYILVLRHNVDDVKDATLKVAKWKMFSVFAQHIISD